MPILPRSGRLSRRSSIEKVPPEMAVLIEKITDTPMNRKGAGLLSSAMSWWFEVLLIGAGVVVIVAALSGRKRF